MRGRFLQSAFARRGARRGTVLEPAAPAAPLRSSEALLAEHARERHERIRSTAPNGMPLLPPPPAFIDPANVLGWPEAEGFVTLREAARRMQRSEEDVLEAVDRGELRARRGGRTILVQPAVVSVRRVAHGPER